jgi:hypothetical protein
MWNMKTLWWILFKLSAETILTYKAPVTLTFDLVTLKINRGHLLVMNNHYVKYENFVINTFQDNQRKPFWHIRPLWPWLCDPKINRGHLLVITNHYVKYDDFVINSFQDNQRKPCGLPTDRPTLAKQYNPFYSKGGIKIFEIYLCMCPF